jgi:hypothetical protein
VDITTRNVPAIVWAIVATVFVVVSFIIDERRLSTFHPFVIKHNLRSSALLFVSILA